MFISKTMCVLNGTYTYTYILFVPSEQTVVDSEVTTFNMWKKERKRNNRLKKHDSGFINLLTKHDIIIILSNHYNFYNTVNFH